MSAGAENTAVLEGIFPGQVRLLIKLIQKPNNAENRSYNGAYSKTSSNLIIAATIYPQI